MAIAKKVMLLGDIGVGKTSIVRRLVFDKFDTNYKATLGVDIYKHVISGGTDEPELEFVIWDVDGDLADSIFNHVYIRGAAGALIICDITRASTRDTMYRLAKAFQESLPGRPFVLVSNKHDLQDETHAADDSPPDWVADIQHFRTSAKTGVAIDDAFNGLATSISRIGL